MENKDIDRKFEILAASRNSGAFYTHEHGVFFKAADPAFLRILRDYPEACRLEGAGPLQIEAAKLMVERVEEFQRLNGIKIPDVTEKESYLLEPTHVE